MLLRLPPAGVRPKIRRLTVREYADVLIVKATLLTPTWRMAQERHVVVLLMLWLVLDLGRCALTIELPQRGNCTVSCTNCLV